MASAPAVSSGLPVAAGPPLADVEVPKGEWQGALRLGLWDEANRLIAALPPRERETPALRLVRARLCIERGEYAAATPLLEGLERDLPLLTDLVAKMRGRVELEVGPFERAGEYFSRGATALAWMKAARAFDKAGDPRSRAAVDRVITSSSSTALVAEARALRVRLTKEPDALMLADLRWLATTGAGTAAGSDALAQLTKADAVHPLAADELLVRAKALGDAGKTDEATRAIDLIARAPGASKINGEQRLHAKGMLFFHTRGRESDAALVLGQCAGEHGPLAAECAFHSARALSRADRDAEAITAYAAVVKKFPGTPWGEQAAFYGPYLRMLHGEWERAADGFELYLKAGPTGSERHDAKRYRGLCHLLAKSYKVARRELENASADEPDPVSSARISNLAALAALGDGDRVHGVALFMKAIREVPLTWPALVARARLAKLGAPLPPYLEPHSPSAAQTPLVVSLPPAAQLLHTLGLEDEAEAALHERESSVLAAAAGRNAEALCEAYGQLGRAERRYQESRQVPPSLLASAPDISTKWAWDCVYPSPYGEIVHAAAAAESIPAGLIYAVMRQESSFHPEAVSGANAIGLLQLVSATASATARSLGLPRDDARLTSPPYNIRVGARHLHDLLGRFRGDVPFAVGAYNAGAPPLERWLSRANGLELDTFVERIPYRETKDYIVRVMGNWAHYAYIEGGEAAVPQLDLSLPDVK